MSDPTPCQALIDARNATGLSQQQLAERAGTTKVTVLRIEKGRMRPSIDIALAIADALDTTVEALFKEVKP
jgi:putative transcriptional regulator